MNRDTKSFKVAGFILRPNSPDIRELFLDIKSKFNSFGIDVLISNRSASMIDLEGIDFDEMCNKSDFLVSLGGDGTLLSLVRRSYKYCKPVLGINAGNLGFLADVRINEVDNFLKQLVDGECRIDKRMMISGTLCIREIDIPFYAFNDIVVTRPIISKMTTIEAYIEDEIFNSYRGDGLIISTPTGSTAYNLAADGPVMYPLTKAFILTPICPHSLTQRPLVLPADFIIKIKTPKEKLIVVVDGQDTYELKVDEELIIKGAKNSAMLLHRKERDYFRVLRDKLSWGDN